MSTIETILNVVLLIILLTLFYKLTLSEGFDEKLVASNVEVTDSTYDNKSKQNYCFVKGLEGATYITGRGSIESTEGIYPGRHKVEIGTFPGPGGRVYNIKGDCPYSYTDKLNVYVETQNA
jgi:hypothetical protein